MDSSGWLLSGIVFLPVLWGLGLLAFPARATGAMRWYALAGSLVELGLTIEAALRFRNGTAEFPGGMSLYSTQPWIATWNVQYTLGIDGLSLPLVLLTSGLFVLSILASWNVTKHARGFLLLMLLLETGVMGVFLSLDFLLFYVFWEVMLLPMYFLIGVWGGPRKEYAAIKFFLYTLFGGVLMLIALLMFYFGSHGSFDLLDLARQAQGLSTPVTPAVAGLATGDQLVADGTFLLSPTWQVTAFVLLLVAFLIKLPSVPFHTWLPDAHVEAPTPVSMLLAGILLKLGGYGLLRIAIPLCPYGFQVCAWGIVAIGAISIIYGALAALAQTDFKRLVAYSSVSHMGYVLIGLAAWKIEEATGATIGRDYWEMGVNAAVFQMVAHGVTSAGMFFMVGVLYDRVHHRDLNHFGGISGRMPHYAGLAAVIFFAGLGLPGLCGFIGEVFAILSSWSFDPRWAIVAALGLVLTAAYILWALQRVYLGHEYRGPQPEHLTPMTVREGVIGYVLVTFAIMLGIIPGIVLSVTGPAAAKLVAAVDAGRVGYQKIYNDHRRRDAGQTGETEREPAKTETASLIEGTRP